MSVVPARIAAWHRAHWYTPAPLAAGVCRVVLATLFILFLKFNLPADYRVWAAGWPTALYRPVGVLTLYGSDGPPVGVLVAAHWTAKIGVGFLLVGLCTRLSLVVVTLAMWHCCSAAYTFAPNISHTFIPGLVAAAGLVAGARSPLSVDYLIDRRGRPGYWATPRAGVAMVMLAVGWSFANAALHKVYLENREWFAWCYSDNLRNLILYQYLKLQAPLPEPVAWVVARPWAYKTMACGNVLCQFLPVFAAFLVRRPRVRLVLAAMVWAELLGLGFVMRVWRGYGDIWLVLPLVFVDWDALLTRRRPAAPPTPVGPDRWWRARRAWVVGLAVAFIVLSCRTRYVRAAYPLLPFSMFSPLYVAKPYLEHRPYPLVLVTWEVDATPPLTATQAGDVFKRYHEGMIHPAAAAEQVRRYCEKTYRVRVDGVRGTKRCFVIPPPPDPTVRSEHDALWVAWQRAAGGPVALVPATVQLRATPGPDGGSRCRLALAPTGLDVAGVRFEYATLGTEGATPVAAADLGTGVYELAFPPDVRGFVFVTARVNDAPYYAAHVRVGD